MKKMELYHKKIPNTSLMMESMVVACLRKREREKNKDTETKERRMSLRWIVLCMNDEHATEKRYHDRLCYSAPPICYVFMAGSCK
ncbi:unnamed protein product [Sphenostylis stenocarpa]|uniref:Uncharacterized protein n=1 Tax=Sphenostylis stenocarpa TaxID=92480 RepID=A0AA86VIC5_9FABA|nr:unnamed protein product [Sphenostylis stenocarpa]